MLSVCLDSSTNMLWDQLACHQEEKLAVEEMRVLLWLGQDDCLVRLGSAPGPGSCPNLCPHSGPCSAASGPGQGNEGVEGTPTSSPNANCLGDPTEVVLSRLGSGWVGSIPEAAGTSVSARKDLVSLVGMAQGQVGLCELGKPPGWTSGSCKVPGRAAAHVCRGTGSLHWGERGGECGGLTPEPQ